MGQGNMIKILTTKFQFVKKMLQKIMRRDFDESVDLGNLETVLLMLNLPFFWIDAHKKLR